MDILKYLKDQRETLKELTLKDDEWIDKYIKTHNTPTQELLYAHIITGDKCPNNSIEINTELLVRILEKLSVLEEKVGKKK